MPVVRNKSGLEKVFVDNLEELGNLSARTDIADTTSSVFLKSSASGVLEVNSSSSLKANDGNDGAGTDRTVKCDGNGILQVKEIGTVNVAPANSVNSHITDDPANSVCVGLKARQTIDTATSETFLLCDIEGKLVTSNNSTRSDGTNIVVGATIAANLQIGSTIDIGTKKSIIIMGKASGNHSINILHSSDNTNFYLYSSVSPVAYDSMYHYNLKIDNGLRYFKLFNSNQSNTFEINYATL